jgi:hypothetical protein
VSSPNDVAPERARAGAVLTKLSREYEGLVRFEAVLWEEQFYRADRTFQAQIPESTACDIVVSIFWTRLGTELPADFTRMEGGQSYPSGTAYELLTALETSRRKGVPDVYVFRKTADAVLSTTDAGHRHLVETQLWRRSGLNGSGARTASSRPRSNTSPARTSSSANWRGYCDNGSTQIRYYPGFSRGRRKRARRSAGSQLLRPSTRLCSLVAIGT